MADGDESQTTTQSVSLLSSDESRRSMSPDSRIIGHRQDNETPPKSPGGNDHDIRTSMSTAAELPTTKRRTPWKVVVQMAIFYIAGLAFMCAHLAFFLWLDGKPVRSSGISQASQSAVANFFAIATEISILGGIGVAYNQFLWRLLRRKSLKAGTIDTLVTLAMSPWDLWRPDIIRDAGLLVLIGLLCALVPVAAVFPPGSLGVEFQEGVVPFTLSNIPTMNISDYGEGSFRDIGERLFFPTSGALDWYRDDKDNLFNPRLLSMASGVLASGGPLPFASPCNGSCTYQISLGGPRFHCKELRPDDGLINATECKGGMGKWPVIYRSPNVALQESDRSLIANNAFKLSFYPDYVNDKCKPDRLKTLNCSMTVAEYVLHIDLRSESRSINVTVANDKDLWPERPFAANVYDEAFGGENALSPEDLPWKFTLLQAWSISRAATLALAGEIRYRYFFKNGGLDDEYNDRVFMGNGTGILGSPYFSDPDLYAPKFNITAEGIQTYLQDLLISMISLSDRPDPLWTYQGDIDAMGGSNVYVFNEQLQFYLPYGVILAVTAGIYIVGLWSLRQNGVSAGGSFLQFAATTSTSRTLHQIAGPCSIGGGENMSRELRDLRLRFGAFKGARNDHADGGEDPRPLVAGFRTENEAENL